MAFTVQDYHDLVQLLEKHPEWKSELRGLLLSEEFLTLPATVRELAEAQRRTEEQVAALAKAQRRTEERMAELTEGLKNLTDKVSRLEGWSLEARYRERAGAYFGRFLRRPQVVDMGTLVDTLEKALTSDECDDVLLLDLLVSGSLRHTPDGSLTWLAMAVSATVDSSDVERAVRRAMLLRRAGYRVVAVVAGEQTTKGAEKLIQSQKIVLLEDGLVKFWEEALSRWIEDSR